MSLLIGSLGSKGQVFIDIPAGNLDVKGALGLRDSCTIELGSFAISDWVTNAQYNEFTSYFLSMSDTNSYGTKSMAKFNEPPIDGDGVATDLTWNEASAYCNWLDRGTEDGKWIHRLPKLSEWLWALESDSFAPADSVGCWLLNAKDESAWSCAEPFDHTYPTEYGTPFSLRRKMVAYEKSSERRIKHGLYEDYWEFIAYPNVGFRVVRVFIPN